MGLPLSDWRIPAGDPGRPVTVRITAASWSDYSPVIARFRMFGQNKAMRCEITQVNGDGTIRRARVDTAGRRDAARWERLAEQARLDLPPPYRPHPGEPVYEISAGERVAQVAEGDLVGPLRELVRAVLADGWDIS